jgi:hypothetical protein
MLGLGSDCAIYMVQWSTTKKSSAAKALGK